MEGFRDKKLKIDPKYVKWIFRLYGKEDGKEYEKILPYRRCTDSDYSEFDEIIPSSKVALEQMKDDEDRGFLCIDWQDEEPYKLYGQGKDANY